MKVSKVQGVQGFVPKGAGPEGMQGALANLPSAPSSVNPLAGLSEEELEKANELAEALRQAQGKGRKERAQIAWRLRMSLSTLDRKIAAFKKRGIVALSRKVRQDKGGSRVADQKVIARIQSLYLQPHRPSVMDVHRAIAKDYELSGLKPPSYSFTRRAVAGIAPDLVARFRLGEKHAEDKFEPVFIRRKPQLPRKWVNADHHQCDHYVLFPDGSIARPWLTAFQDICNNEILGYNIPRDKKVGDGNYPGSESIALALRQAVLKKDDPAWPSYGLFDNLYVDLGRDFRSQHVRAVCHDLGIEIVHTRGYHGKSKPIERWFGILEAGLKHLPGYCGSKPEENPERQKIKPEPLDPKKLLTLDEFEAALRQWVVHDYHHRESTALRGLSPIEALNYHVKSGFSAREVRDERVLDLLLMRREKRKVRNLGIQLFSTPERQRFFAAPEIWPLMGQEVDVYWDPAKLGEIFIYQGNRFICRATNRELLEFGDSAETLERAREIRRNYKRSRDERFEEMMKEGQYTDPEARARAEQRNEKVLDEERKKIAVGAEAEGVPVLLPKYQQAVKRLNAKGKLQIAKGKTEDRSLCAPRLGGENHYHRDTEIAEQKEEEALPTLEELFPREEKPEWLKEMEREEEEKLKKPFEWAGGDRDRDRDGDGDRDRDRDRDDDV